MLPYKSGTVIPFGNTPGSFRIERKTTLAILVRNRIPMRPTVCTAPTGTT
jgi:hypothetical protein